MDNKDERLVQQTLCGDRDSFNRLVQKYQATVYGFAYHWTHNFADAQDLTQETFFQAYQKLDQLRDASKFANWLRRIAANVCRMWQRRQCDIIVSIDAPDNRKLLDKLHDRSSPPQAVLEAKEKQKVVADVLSVLSDKIRLTATLFYIEDLSYGEISDFLGVPITTVESRLHKARKQLKKEMVQEILGKQIGHKRKKSDVQSKMIRREVYQMDAIRVTIGEELIPFCKPETDEILLSHITQMRETLASEIGFAFPAVHIVDNLDLSSRRYEIFIYGERVAQGELETDDDLSGFSTLFTESIKKHCDKFTTQQA